MRRIRIHNTRRICGLLLAALDVHPGVAMHLYRPLPHWTFAPVTSLSPLTRTRKPAATWLNVPRA